MKGVLCRYIGLVCCTLLLVAIILMMPAIILALKVEPTSDEQITAVVFGILSAVVSYLSRD